MDTVLRSAAVYVMMLLVIRLTGRKTMSQLAPFDFVLLLIGAQSVQQALLGDDFSLINALVVMLTLTTLNIGLSYLKRWSPRVDKLLDGRPTLLVSHGTVDERALSRSRVDLTDILSAARQRHGLERLEQVRYAILETDGNLSIIPR